MADRVDDSMSDGLEILSIGALYTGPWDKKYWSSSRGKDRYPYPVGYKALRTRKGLTYKMEIHEGSKGPIFKIISNDKEFGSGETPDRAWENFQKKSLSRIKLWHGKRSSGKIDGVEFFGFKNALVQRLLRELVSTIHDASDQSAVITCCNEVSSAVLDTGFLKTNKYPDLRSCLEKTTVTSKRSRNSRGIDTKAVCKRGKGRCHPLYQGNDAKVLTSAPGKMDVDDSLISCALSDHANGDLQVLPNIELGENVLSKDPGLSVKSHEVSGDPKAEPCLIQVQRELPSMETQTAVCSLGMDMPQKEKPEEIINVLQLDIQRIDVQGVGLPVVTDEGGQKVLNLSDLLKARSPLLQGLQRNHVGDLFVPDTYDTQQEITCGPNFSSCEEKQAIATNESVSDLVLTEETRTGSHSEEGSYYLNDSSEKTDFDSVDEDISKSMMSLLLPLAIPLLTYSSRKRRRKSKIPKDSPCAPILKNLNGAIPSADVKSPAGTLICSGSDEHKKAHLPSASIDSGLSVMGNVRYIVPDSLDNDQYEDYVGNKPPPSDNSEAVATNLEKEKHELDKKGSSRVLDDTEWPSLQNETTGYKDLRYVPDSLDREQYEDFLSKELSPSDNAETAEANLQKKKCKPDNKGLSPILQITESASHQNGATRLKNNSRCIVPDSLHCDQYEDHVANELPTSGNAEAVATKLEKKYEPDKKLSPVLDATELSSWKDETTGFQENVRYVVPDSVDDDQYEDYVANELPPSYHAEAVAANLQKENHEPDKIGPRSISVPGKQHCSLAKTLPRMGKNGAPQSETIICRDIQDNGVPEIHRRSENLVLHNSYQVGAFGDSDIRKTSFSGGRFGRQISYLQNDVEDALAQNCILLDQVMSSTFNKDDIQFIDGYNTYLRNSKAYIDKDIYDYQNFDSVCQSPDQGRGSSQNCALHIKEDEAEIHTICRDKHELNDEIQGAMNLIGCYSHPMHISSVMLTRKLHDIYICVSCGLLEERKRDLLLYKLCTTGPSQGSPCMVGHTSMILPPLKDEFGRDVAVDKSGMQFTPDARGLVLADSIMMPYCREKNLQCLCPQCESCCFEENAVKIVLIELGYVSIVVKLKTMFPVHCVLVCEPEHLVALDESGRIYIWILNSTWSVQTEEYVIPSYDHLPSRIVELKRIPQSASMVVGHNGYGEFSLWDIIKRTLVSRFSAPGSSVIDFLPVSLFNWLSKDLSHDKVIMEGCVRKLQEATMSWFSKHNEANISCSMKGEETAVWLLICVSSESPAQSACCPRNHHLNSDGCWRLGLLIKDVVILGAALYSSTTAIGTSSGTGIIGTHGGQVYVWELATGSKLEAFHDLEGNEVLHIATDDSTSTAVAIAGGGGQLCVYLRP